MNLFKTSFLSSIETAIKLASGFVVIKYIAVHVGREGVAFFGQFQSFITAFILLISGGFTTGLVCYSAQEKPGSKTSNDFLGNALGLGLFSTLGAAIFICLFASKLSEVILKTSDYSNLFYLLAFCGVLIMINQVIIASFNGWGELVRLIVCKSVASLLLLIFSLILVNFYGLTGGLVALISMQALPVFLGVSLLTGVTNFKWQWLIPRFNFLVYKKFFPYWLMSIVTLISTPLILMFIRIYIVTTIGWDMAGIWEASWRISELYLLVITTALTTYYVPKLSQVENRQEELNVVKEVLILGFVAASLLATMIYIGRFWIINLLFSNDFLMAGDILAFQLLGSVVKITAWVFSYYMLVKRRTTLFLIAELLFGASFYIFSRFLFDKLGIIGLSYAYLLNYTLYLIYCAVYFFKDNNLLFFNLRFSQDAGN
ncbi:O-antigen translocase [Legionella fairfieldensis]|uniref:O-antigen translocase n=1 Tax=Legionella fairfieldensis TaxID=45064 RepID=UPI00048E4351|nr:O-antigen translocase [Legionella fairfieldensis]